MFVEYLPKCLPGTRSWTKFRCFIAICLYSTFFIFYLITEKEAKSVNSYLHTRFFRFLVSLRKITLYLPLDNIDRHTVIPECVNNSFLRMFNRSGESWLYGKQ